MSRNTLSIPSSAGLLEFYSTSEMLLESPFPAFITEGFAGSPVLYVYKLNKKYVYVYVCI